jgi:hypothetical protein
MRGYSPRNKESREDLTLCYITYEHFIEMLDGNFNMLMNYKMDGTTPEETNSSNQGGE